MPNGKTHAIATVFAAGAAGPIGYFGGGLTVIQSAALMIGAMLGLIINPDLDVQIGSRSIYLVKRSFGPLIGFLWRWFWQPYAHLIPRHRHPLSHLPILGTALRILYLFLVIGGVYWASRTIWVFLLALLPSNEIPLFLVSIQQMPPPPGISDLLAWPIFWWFAMGLAISDTLHTLMDYTWPWQ